MDKIKVGVNGYGIIGSRVADAIAKQHDLELVGVTKTRPDFRFTAAQEKNIPVYGVYGSQPFAEKGYSVEGTVKDLLDNVDIMIDCSPKAGGENVELYRQFPNVKVMFQGGEPHELANFSFNSSCNFDEARDRKYLRVVSCNTTALCRTIQALNQIRSIKKVRVAIARRTVDPTSNRKGHLNAWVPSMGHPSHHAADVNTVLPSLKITSLAGIAPMTLMHGHMLFVEFDDAVTSDEAIEQLGSHSRIKLFSYADGFESTAQIKESAKNNGNIYEVGIWKESVEADEDGEIGMHLAIDQQAVTIPENVDAVRAMFGLMTAEQSIELTNRSLGISIPITKETLNKR